MRPSKQIFDSQPQRLITSIQNVFTTPTTASEASDDAKEIQLEEDLLSHCKDKERFLTILYSLKDKDLEILFPFMELLKSLIEGQDGQRPHLEPKVVVGSRKASRRTSPKRRQYFSNINTPKYYDWDFIGTHDGLSMSSVMQESGVDEEAILIEDVLNVLLGYDGRYIKANSLNESGGKRTFRLSSHIRSSLRGLVEKILQVASDYSSVVRFLSENTSFSAGRVNQALSAAFASEISVYMDDVVKLEYIKNTGGLSLYMVWDALKDRMSKMRIIARLTDYVRRENSRGAETLNVLHMCTSTSLADAEAEKICLSLTKAASAPYFKTVEKWLFRGILDDPLDEFMVRERPEKGKMDWNDRFELRGRCVPTFLRQVDKLILDGGRYVRAMRECVPCLQEPPCVSMQHLEYDSIQLACLDAVIRGYNSANEALLSVLANSAAVRWLNKAKSFFCSEKDDVFYNIVISCQEELEKPACSIFLPRLQGLVDKWLPVTYFGEPLSFCAKLEQLSLLAQVKSLHALAPKGVDESLSGFEALTFTTDPPGPLNILFHSKTLVGFQMLFRHLFFLKYVYIRLTRNRLSCASQPFQALNHSMTVFVQTCLSYATLDTIQALWDEFVSGIRSASSVRELVQLHNQFLYRALMGTFLGAPSAFERLRRALDLCLDFCTRADLGVKNDFEDSLVILVKEASKESQWSSFVNALVPTFANIPGIPELNGLCME